MENNLNNLILRTNLAYKRYLRNRTYHNALHIYHANSDIYILLNEELLKPKSSLKTEEVINYLFHLEDWFLLFEKNAELINDFEDTFIFEAFKDSISFPNYFKLNDKI